MTAGSLAAKHRFDTTNYTTAATTNASSSNPYGIFALYERGAGERVELHYYLTDSNKRITHEKAERVLSRKQIWLLRKEAKAALIGTLVHQPQAQYREQGNLLTRNNK